jgi:hypothetical protein
MAPQLVITLPIEEEEGVFCFSISMWVMMASIVSISFGVNQRK